MQALIDAQRGHIERQAAVLMDLKSTHADGLHQLEVSLLCAHM